MTFYELRDSVLQWLQGTREGNCSLWDALVASSREMQGDGCDGILFGRAEDHWALILKGVPMEEMIEMWKETENGMIAIEEGIEEVEKEVMIHDIGIDLCECLLEETCRQACRIMKG